MGMPIGGVSSTIISCAAGVSMTFANTRPKHFLVFLGSVINLVNNRLNHRATGCKVDRIVRGAFEQKSSRGDM